MIVRYRSLDLLIRANEAYFRLADLCQNIGSFLRTHTWDEWREAVHAASRESLRLDIAVRVGHE